MKSTEQTRLELLAVLAQLSRLRPEWRLGQTMANLAMTAGRLDAGGVWDLEDDEALTAARELVAQYSESKAEAAKNSCPRVELQRLDDVCAPWLVASHGAGASPPPSATP